MTDQEPVPFRLPAEVAECYRYEISGAMDSAVLYCHDVVDRHSHRRLWTPKGDHPDHHELIAQARAPSAAWSSTAQKPSPERSKPTTNATRPAPNATARPASNNFLYDIKAPRKRGARQRRPPGRRSCLRPATAQAPSPAHQKAAAWWRRKGVRRG